MQQAITKEQLVTYQQSREMQPPLVQVCHMRFSHHNKSFL